MAVVWGVALVVLSLLAWGGQVVSWLAPARAARLGLTEPEGSVEPAFHAWNRGEAMWDSFTLWAMVVAGILLMLDVEAWAYFGLVGGGMYVYFAGLGIAARLSLSRRGFRIGRPQGVKSAYLMLSIWGVAGLITLVAAVRALPTS